MNSLVEKEYMLNSNNDMPKFSIVLIARNEEKTLPRLLNSLEEFKTRGGEVVLLDTGSSDKTATVARDWGCKVEEVGDRFVKYIDKELSDNINERFGDTIVKDGDKNFDFSSARNYAASLASNDMISMPDCDEIFTKLDIDAVDKYIEDGFEQLEFNFVFAHGPNGEETVKFIQCKFYDRRKMEWTGVIHEVLKGSAKKTLMPESVFKIEHYQNEETNRSGYLVGLALDCYYNPTNDRNCHYFARELWYRGFADAALREFERYLTIGWWDAERAETMLFIGDINMYKGNEKEALEWYFKASLESDKTRKALIKLGEHFFHKKDWKRTITYLEGCLLIPYSGFYADNMEHYRDYPLRMLYAAHWWNGNKEKSREYFNQCIDINPKSVVYQAEKYFYYSEDLPKISILIPTLKRPEGLKRCLDSIKLLNYPEDKLEVLVEEDEPRLGVAKRLNSLYARSTGEWIVYGSNDIEFTPNCLLEVLKVSDGVSLISFNTGELLPDEGNICEHFMVKRDYIDCVLGSKIFDEDFNHIGVDNLLWSKCKDKVRADKAIVNHYHFSKGYPIDEVYQLGWNEDSVKADRELLKSKI